jgi:hypothetical protein
MMEECNCKKGGIKSILICPTDTKGTETFIAIGDTMTHKKEDRVLFGKDIIYTRFLDKQLDSENDEQA